MKLGDFVPESLRKPVAAGLMATSLLAGGQDGLAQEPRVESRTNAVQLAEAKIPQKRIDGSTWDAHPNDVDEYLESVIYNAGEKGVLEVKKLKDPQYVLNWKNRARTFEKPADFNKFLSGIFILKGRGDEQKRVISDEQGLFLLNYPDLVKAKFVMGQIYTKLLSETDVNSVKSYAGQKILELSQQLALK